MPYVCHGDCVHIRALNPAGVQTLIHKCMAAPLSSKHLCIPPGHSVYNCGSERLKCFACCKPQWQYCKDGLYLCIFYTSWCVHLCRHEQLLQNYVVFNLLTSFSPEDRLTTLDNKTVCSTARGIGNQNARAAVFFSFIMCLTANNVQWIKAPVCRSHDNSDENTANHLPPTMQFKAHGSNMSAQVGKCCRRDWSSLSPDRSCLCMPPPPRRSEANSRRAVSTWAGGRSVRGVYTVSEEGECVEETGLIRCECNKAGAVITLRCAALPQGKGCRAFDAAGVACEEKGNYLWGVQSVCGWTAHGVSWQYGKKTCVCKKRYKFVRNQENQPCFKAWISPFLP